MLLYIKENSTQMSSEHSASVIVGGEDGEMVTFSLHCWQLQCAVCLTYFIF